MSHRKAIRDHYEPRIGGELPSHEVLDWASAEGQLARLRMLCRNVDLVGKRILDVGCGLGDLWGLLEACGIEADYTGVDLLEPMVAEARARHPGVDFRCCDVFADCGFEPESFDVVFASGAFNLNLGNNEAFLASALPRLLELSRDVVVFNLLRRHDDDDPRYFYYEPDAVLPLLAEHDGHVELLDDYLPSDFTIVCRTRPATGPRGSCAACAKPCDDARA